MMRRDILVYLSGPITAGHGRTVAENIDRAATIYLGLIQAGVPCLCPHLSAYNPAAFLVPYDRWLELDYVYIDKCTHMLMLPHWEESKGALLEQAYAIQQGIIVLYAGEYARLVEMARDADGR